MKNLRSLVILAAAALLLVLSVLVPVSGAGTVPGSAADPVVSKSYVDAQTKALQDRVTSLESRFDSLPGASEGPSAPAAAAFEVVKLEAGQSLTAGAGAEIILRSGTASAIGSSSGGVADVTEGSDLATGAAVSKNHLLLIPADDGRGIKCASLCYVMVKGGYTVK